MAKKSTLQSSALHTIATQIPKILRTARSLGITRRKFSSDFVTQHLRRTASLASSPTGKGWARHTLSQSSFCLVRGKALLKPLNVFSPISWYVSFKEDWYFPSSDSISANILDAEEAGEVGTMAEGSKIDIECVVVSCT